MSTTSSIASTSSLYLPSYSPSSAAPRYSPEPLEDEYRLDFVARQRNESTATGTFVKKSGPITVVLSGQEDGVALPTYGRNGMIRGEILLDEETTVHSVTVKVMSETLNSYAAFILIVSLA